MATRVPDESDFGEVQDAIAAGRHVCELPYVDQDRVFVAGHSVGGALVRSAAMMPSDFKAAAALSGYLDMASWAEWGDFCIAFDRTNPDDISWRNPMGFVNSLQIPVVLYAERGWMRSINNFCVWLPTPENHARWSFVDGLTTHVDGATCGAGCHRLVHKLVEPGRKILFHRRHRQPHYR